MASRALAVTLRKRQVIPEFDWCLFQSVPTADSLFHENSTNSILLKNEVATT